MYKMMHPDTKELIENWEVKSEQINTENLDGLYNKFTPVFTIYNRLYNETFSILKGESRVIQREGVKKDGTLKKSFRYTKSGKILR